MPRVLNLGSVNIDHVYHVPHFVQPGETLASTGYARGAGGKGFNQSVALARAGASVAHAGAVGEDGAWLVERLRREGVDVARLRTLPREPTGHAIIQVSPEGQNAIVLHAGANHALADADIRGILAGFAPGDRLLCQNETSGVATALSAGQACGLEVWFNPAPMTDSVSSLPLDAVDWLVVNETEGAALSGESAPEAILDALLRRRPRLRVVLTLGAEGVVYASASERVSVASPRVRAVDTTAAGDTFIGYLLAGTIAGLPVRAALERACAAAALGVTRPGAADSVPFAHELPPATRP